MAKPAFAAVSPSELKLGNSCLRKWAARYLPSAWPRDKGTAATNITGNGLHDCAEKWNNWGQPPREITPVTQLFVSGMHFMSRPRTGLIVEQMLRFTIDGLPMEIKVDWAGRARDVPSWQDVALHPEQPVIVDYKTSGNVKEYGLLTYESKIVDEQSLIYAYVLGGGQDTGVRHLYFQKTKQILLWEAEHAETEQERDKIKKKANYALVNPKIIPADALLRGQDLTHQMQRIVLPPAERLYQLRAQNGNRNVNPLDYEPNPNHCQDYGGCPHFNGPSRDGSTYHNGPCVLTKDELTRACMQGFSQL